MSSEDEFGLDLTISDLIALGVLEAGAPLFGTVNGSQVDATLLADGSIEFDGEVYTSLSGAGKAALGRIVNGWWFWSTQTEDGPKRLRKIRREYANEGLSEDDQSDAE